MKPNAFPPLFTHVTYFSSRGSLSDGSASLRVAARQCARARDEAAKLSFRKKWAVRGQRAFMRAPPMAYFIASSISFQVLPPGAQERSLHRNAARLFAARHGLLLPASMGRHTYQRTQCHRLRRLLRGDFAHSSAGGSYPRIRHPYSQ